MIMLAIPETAVENNGCNYSIPNVNNCYSYSPNPKEHNGCS